MTGGENRGRGEEKKPREEEEGIVVPWLQFLITCSMQSNMKSEKALKQGQGIVDRCDCHNMDVNHQMR